MAHALILTKAPGFIKIVTDETIWQELTDIRFTTPVLRTWVPYISKEMSTGDPRRGSLLQLQLRVHVRDDEKPRRNRS